MTDDIACGTEKSLVVFTDKGKHDLLHPCFSDCQSKGLPLDEEDEEDGQGLIE